MRCKICNHDTKVLLDTQLNQSYFYCENCEFIALNDSFMVSLEREKAQYENHHNSLENSGYVQMFENFLDFFWQNFTCKDTDVLDFGSGPTPVLAHLVKKRGATVDIYDKFYQPIMPPQTKKYDLITSTEVFEHLENPIETLTLLARYLKPNGHIAIMTLFHTNQKEVFLHWWYRRDPTHISFYTPKTLAILGEACGLKRVKHDEKRIAVFSQ